MYTGQKIVFRKDCPSLEIKAGWVGEVMKWSNPSKIIIYNINRILTLNQKESNMIEKITIGNK